jgi:hypothetical protein
MVNVFASRDLVKMRTLPETFSFYSSVVESIQAREAGDSRSLRLTLIVTAIARFAGSLIAGDSILGLAPQALCCRPLRGLSKPTTAWQLPIYMSSL